MSGKNDFILVPWDFTKVAENALLHGIKIARMVGTEIVLLHIVSENTGQDAEKKIRSALNDIVHDYKASFSMGFQGKVMKGHIYSTISEYANVKNAAMVIMGTHGLKGLQKVTGSWALKVIAGSKVPFIVVQEKPAEFEKYKNIVFPLDFKTENKDKLRWAIFMGKYFDSKVHILKKKEEEKSMQKKIDLNLTLAMRYLIQNALEYEIHELPLVPNFAKESLAFAQDINADLIIITTTRNLNPARYILGPQEQYIIANSSKIPVMCVNPDSSIKI